MRKWLAIPVLLLGVLTSVIIVIDSAEWYSALYSNLELFGWVVSASVRGLVFAGVLEAYLAVLLALRTKEHERVDRALWLLAGFIFMVIGFATYEGIVSRHENDFTSTKRIDQQITQKNQSIAQNEVNMDFARQTNQKVNLARLQADNRKLNDELTGLNAQVGQISTLARLQLWFLGMAKFGVLLANSFSYWWVGAWIRRAPEEKEEPPVLEEELPIKRPWLPAWMLQLAADYFAFAKSWIAARGEKQPVVEQPIPKIVQLRARDRMWTREEFATEARKNGFNSLTEIANKTGLGVPVVSAVFNHAHKVISLITRPNVPEDSAGAGTAHATTGEEAGDNKAQDTPSPIQDTSTAG